MRQDSVRMMTPHGGVDERALGPSTDHVGHEDKIGCQQLTRLNPSYEDIEQKRAEVIEDFWRFVGRERLVVTELPVVEEIEEFDRYSGARAYARAFNEAYGEPLYPLRPDERRIRIRLTARGRKVRR